MFWLFEQFETSLKGPFIVYFKERLFTVLLMESRNRTVPASLKLILSGRWCLGNITSIDEGSAKNVLHLFTDKTNNLYIILKL